ncbi:MAG: hypothetical protein NVSMB69_05070 [Novosphingobium sp.]
MVEWHKAGLLVAAAAALAGAGVEAPARTAAAVAYTADGRAMLPGYYRDWVFLTSGLDMTYADPAAASQAHMFDNVFVDPAALASFRRTGRWPEGTVLVKEAREGLTKGSINKAGQFQSEAVANVELHVKDSRRFGGWAFFKIVDGKPGAMIPKTATCYSCHDEHGAIDSTFVQFYPTLAGVARARGTMK